MKVHAAVLATLLLSTPAQSGVRITVDPAAPFTQDELARALELRLTDPRAHDVDVRVGRLGFDRLIVVVGDRTDTVTLADHDRQTSARVVAVVVSSLVDGAGPPPGEPPPSRSATGRGRTWSLLASLGYQYGTYDARPDAPYEDFDVTMVRAGVARTIRPHVRALATIGIGKLPRVTSDMYGLVSSSPDAYLVPLRLGVEASLGPIAVELGGQHAWLRTAECPEGIPSTASAALNVYGATRLFVPVSAELRGVIELGADLTVGHLSYGPCMGSSVATQRSVWAGAGFEWAM